MDVSESQVAEIRLENVVNDRTMDGVHFVRSELATAATPPTSAAEFGSKQADSSGGKVERKAEADGEDSTPSDNPKPQGDDSATPGGSGGSRANRKRKRTRRNRRNKKKLEPYSKSSWPEREPQRANKIRERMFLSGQPVAPYNTTQFLIEDHNESIEIDMKEHNAAPHHVPRHKRARDSSFSYDSEEDFYYSSPEDEEEYYLKDFANTYDSLHSDQLQSQTKTKLVQDVLALEKRVEGLQKELTELKGRCDASGEDKVLLYKAEITKLSEENNRLRAENECLRRKCVPTDVPMAAEPSAALRRVSTEEDSSMDSESDSHTSTGSSSSSEAEDVQQEAPCQRDEVAPQVGGAEQ
ncbi:protein HEXIM2-like [Neocloeon triangulifer]|uniref:protein HEXIM2-like n=1 Tax=Neocloeon triangulifer TaxID=2078957 RepID=UPI00286F7C48|nr:protein HEXIM2-like [Neocloeon triangulifer]